MQKNDSKWLLLTVVGLALPLAGCTVKAVGDPKRPITIEAHVVVDVKGLQNTATNIEDFVSGKATKEDLTNKK